MSTAPDAPVTYTQRDAVGLITLDDGRANAFSLDVIAAVNAALDRAEADARAVVLSGRPGRFSAGFDLAVMNGDDVDAVQALLRAGGELSIRIWMHPQPVIAACTGHAMALGAILLMAADTRYGVAGAYKIGTNEVAIGLPVPRFAVAIARDRLSRRHLQTALHQAEIFDPPGAVDAGFLDALCEPEEVEATAIAHAQRLTETLHRGAFRRTREFVRGEAARLAAEGLVADVADVADARRR